MTLQPEQASFLLQVLLPQLKSEHKTTLKVLQAVPDDQAEYRPDPRSMTAIDLSWHTASAEWFFMTLAATGSAPEGGKRPDEVQTPSDVATWYAEMFAPVVEKVSSVTGDQLVKVIEFYKFKETAIGYLQLMLAHGIHHRGQLSAYLRPMGGKVPAIYGGSADEPLA